MVRQRVTFTFVVEATGMTARRAQLDACAQLADMATSQTIPSLLDHIAHVEDLSAGE